MDPHQTVVPGSRFGPYEILSPLGAGGMGQFLVVTSSGSTTTTLTLVVDWLSEATPSRARASHT